MYKVILLEIDMILLKINCFLTCSLNFGVFIYENIIFNYCVLFKNHEFSNDFSIKNFEIPPFENKERYKRQKDYTIRVL